MTEPTTQSAAVEAASMALMYLQTGFIECERCGNEVQTKNCDAAFELASVVDPAPDTRAPIAPATGVVEAAVAAERRLMVVINDMRREGVSEWADRVQDALEGEA